jgi:hypothetical protein
VSPVAVVVPISVAALPVVPASAPALSVPALSVVPLALVVLSVRPAVTPTLFPELVVSAASQYVSLMVQASSSTSPKHPSGNTRHRAARVAVAA